MSIIADGQGVSIRFFEIYKFFIRLSEMFYFQLCKLWYHSVGSTSSTQQQRLHRKVSIADLEVLDLLRKSRSLRRMPEMRIFRTNQESCIYGRNAERGFLGEI